MVDLVKIRKKKAKEKEEAANAAAETAQTTSGGAAAASAAERAPAEQAAPSADTSSVERPAAEAAAAPQERGSDAPAPAQSTGNQQPATTPAAVNKLDRFKQEAGKRRAAETFAQEEETSAQLELLTFAIAREHYAVDIERIVEIVTPRPVTRIPNADPSVVGIISLRGTIVTLVDVRRKLRHPPAGEPDAETRIVVIDFHHHEMVGFLVDRVLRVVKTTPGAIEPHPVVHAAELDDSVRGVFLTGGALTILLDLDKLLDHSALAATMA